MNEATNITPKSIRRLDRSHVIADTGEIYPIGISPIDRWLNAGKLSVSPNHQERVDQAVVQAARELTHLPHFQYASNKHEQDNIMGTLPNRFFERIEGDDFR